MDKGAATASKKDEMLERVAREIYSAFRVNSDDSWNSLWAWHTAPESVSNGGEWVVITRARRIIRIFDTAASGSSPNPSEEELSGSGGIK